MANDVSADGFHERGIGPASGPERELRPLELGPRTRELLEILEDRFESDVPRLYRAALHVMSDEQNPARIPLAAAALREVMDQMEADAGFAHSPPDWKKRIATLEQEWQRTGGTVDGNAKFKDAVEEFFEHFRGVPTREQLALGTFARFDPAARDAPPAVRQARAKTWGGLRFDFNLFLHRKRRPAENEFRLRVEVFEGFLLDWLRPQTFADLDAIDQLLRAGPPATQSDRERLAAFVRRTATNHEYFFERVDGPAWLPALQQEKFFRRPPPPERGEDWVRFPSWSESRFLIRVSEQAPADVFAIAERFGPTDNPRVHQDLLEILTRLPGPMAATLARREARWLTTYAGHLMSLPSAVGDALAHLAREGQLDAAYMLARAALAISPGEAESARLSPRPIALMGDYAYGRILQEAWPAMLASDTRRAFRFLCDRLNDVVELGYIHGEDGYDSTKTWRSAIEPHAQNSDHSLLDLLVDFVRDHAIKLSEDPSGLALVLAELRRRNRPMLFTRLALHVIRESGDASLVAAQLVDPELVFKTETWHEWGELLRARFADLGQSDCNKVLAIIEAGEKRVLTETLRERGVTADDLDRWNRRARLERYAVIEDHLRGQAKDIFDELVAELGRPEHPTFLSYMTSWSGPTSPFSGDELRAMRISELVRTLQDWIPSEGREDPSREGLGRILQGVVAQDADTFAAAAACFKELDPTYVRALLSGLENTARDRTAFAWDAVLELAEWVIEQPRSEDDPGDDSRGDPHWGWARRELAGLLDQGLREGPAELPRNARHRIWSILEALVDDPDPSPDREVSEQDSRPDFPTMSINATRGVVLHAVVRYALWVERLIGDEKFEGERSIPEVATLLDARLAVDRSRAVRSVYGQWFPQFVRMDEQWARRLVPRVFPLANDQGLFFDAAWDGYVKFNSPYDEVFALLEQAYGRAVDRMDPSSGQSSFYGDPAKRLGEHLLPLRARGEAAAAKLFERYWKAAPPQLRDELLTSTGWSLGNSESLPSGVAERLVRTWGWILEDASRAGEVGALGGFGAWFGAAALDDRWLLEQAVELLRRGVYLQPDHAVYEALPRLAPFYPALALDVLDGMVRNDKEGWALHGSTKEVRDTFEVVLVRGDADARRRAKALIDVLGARGFNDFRDLAGQ